MKKQKKDTPQLVAQFKDPLDGVESIFIKSSSDAESYLSDIEAKIKNKVDWSVRADGIQLALSCLKGGITKCAPIDFSTFSVDLASCITDLRSALVRSGSLLVAASSQILQDKYVTSIKVVIPALFKQLTHGTALISNSCHLALLEIAKNVQNTKTFHTFMSKIQSKSSQHRLAISDMISVILETWPSSLLLPLNESISSALQTLIDDAAQNVRKSARHGMLLLKSKSTSEISLIRRTSSVNKTTQKKQSKSTLSKTLQPTSSRPSHIPKIPKIFINSNNNSNNNSNSNSNNNNSNNNNNNSNQKKIRSFSPVKQSKKSPPERPVPSEKRTPVKPSRNNKVAFVTPQPKRDHSVKFIELPNDAPAPRETDFYLTLPVVKPKGILKPSKFPNIIREDEIEQFMPPKTMEEADSFQQCLVDIIDTEMFDKFDGIENHLCTSIISAAQFIPMIDEWDSILPSLFRQYPSDFKVGIQDLIIAFRCDPWLISVSCDNFGAEYLADKFMNLRGAQKLYATKFFCSFFSQKISIHITDALSAFLTNIIEQNRTNEDIKYIESALAPKQPDARQMTHIIIQKILGLKDFSEDAAQLNSSILKSPRIVSIIEPVFLGELRPIIEEGQNKQKFAAYSFIQKMPSYSFIFLVGPMICLLSSEDRELVEKTRVCLLNMMNDRKLFSFILELLASQASEEDEVKEQCILSLLLNYFQICSEQVAEDLLPETFMQLSPMLESYVTALRRIVVLILVEFKCKIPKSFEHYSTQIPTKHQKLIELFISRRKVKNM